MLYAVRLEAGHVSVLALKSIVPLDLVRNTHRMRGALFVQCWLSGVSVLFVCERLCWCDGCCGQVKKVRRAHNK